MSMSKKDYVAIAAVVKPLTGWCTRKAWRIEPEAVEHIAHELANVMQADNPRFDRARFLAACGVAASDPSFTRGVQS